MASLPAYENYTGAAHLRGAVPRDLTAVDAYEDYKTGITSPLLPVSADEAPQEKIMSCGGIMAATAAGDHFLL